MAGLDPPQPLIDPLLENDHGPWTSLNDPLVASNRLGEFEGSAYLKSGVSVNVMSGTQHLVRVAGLLQFRKHYHVVDAPECVFDIDEAEVQLGGLVKEVKRCRSSG